MKKFIIQDSAMTGLKIRVRRTEIRLSQAELAYAVGVSSSAVQSWEAGQRTPSPRFIPRLLQILHVTAADLAVSEIEISTEEPTATGETEYTAASAAASGPLPGSSDDDGPEPFHSLFECYESLNDSGKAILLSLAEMLRTHPTYSVTHSIKD